MKEYSFFTQEELVQFIERWQIAPAPEDDILMVQESIPFCLCLVMEYAT